MPPKQTITLRIIVDAPVPGVTLAVQHKKDALIAPTRTAPDATIFEVQAEVKRRPDGTLSLAGPEVQGPPTARFIYVNVGTYAGDAASPWSRRTKIQLGGITDTLVAQVLGHPELVLEARYAGRGKDGTPSCATVPLLAGGWRCVSRL